MKITRKQLRKIINEDLTLSSDLSTVLKGSLSRMDKNVRILKKVDRHLDKVSEIMDDLIKVTEPSVLRDVLEKIGDLSKMYSAAEILVDSESSAPSEFEDAE